MRKTTKQPKRAGRPNRPPRRNDTLRNPPRSGCHDMPKPTTIDFNAVMTDLSKFQQEVGKIHQQLTSPRQKEVLGEALDRVRQARAEVERTYKPTIQKIEDSARESAAQAEALKAENEQLKQQYQQKAAAQRAKKENKKKRRAQAMKAPKPPKVQAGPLSLHAAPQLRQELLSRFQSKPAQPASRSKADREIWEDWNWDENGPTDKS
jgi:hypothetical protein